MEIINHECYVSLEVAKLLKEAGFDWMCSSLYGMDVRHKGTRIDEDEEYELKSSGKVDEIEYIDGGAVYNIYNDNRDPYCYSRPTLDVAQIWLREVKGRLVLVGSVPENFFCTIYEYKRKIDHIFIESDSPFDTYEEAQEAGIKKALELILKKGE